MIDGEMMPITWDEATRVIVTRLKNDNLALEAELRATKRALCLLRADYADLQVYANVEGIGMENGKACDFFAKSRDYWTKKADKFKEEN